MNPTLQNLITQILGLSRKDKTRLFNSLDVETRIQFLESLTETQREVFLDDIRSQGFFWCS